MKFEVIRHEYEADRTIGQLEIDGVFFCWTLEDRVRPPGEKVYGETAIPEGIYKVTVEPFRGDENKLYPYLHDVPMFTGVCMHGGNRPEDTLGCLLLGFERNGKEIYNSAVHEISSIMQEQLSLNIAIELIIRNGC